MSGIGEIVGIIACVAGVISAYKDASIIIQKIKTKRAANRAAPPSRLLEESVDQAPDEIEREKQRGIARFGRAFEKGDEVAIIALQGVTIELQKRLLEKLRDAAYDDEVHDFMYLVDVTDVQRDRTIATLLELKQRLLIAKPIVEVRETRPQVRSDQTGRWNSQRSMEPNNSIQPSRSRTAMEARLSEAQQPHLPDQRKRRSTLLEILKPHRTKPTPTMEAQSRGSVPAPPISRRKQVALPPAPNVNTSTSVDSDDWEDSQKIWGRPSSSTERKYSLQIAPGSLETPNRSPSYSRSDGMKSSAVAMPTPDNDYLGFCKGAWKLQNGDRKAMQKCKEFNDGWSSSSVYYLRCTAKCAFAVHMDLETIWDKVWSNESCRLKFRWPFLAKSHVAQLKVKGNNFAYQCMFCVFQGQKSPVMHGTDLYLQHIQQEHGGQLLSEVILHRSNCISGRIADDNEQFDINLWPPAEVNRTASDQTGTLSSSLLNMEIGSNVKAKASSEGNDSLFQVSASEPWNQNLSDFHWNEEPDRMGFE